MFFLLLFSGCCIELTPLSQIMTLDESTDKKRKRPSAANVSLCVELKIYFVRKMEPDILHYLLYTGSSLRLLLLRLASQCSKVSLVETGTDLNIKNSHLVEKQLAELKNSFERR
jgi:hypothetical protein